MLVVLVWSFYVALTVLGLCESRRARYFVYYAILCTFLILNVVGCHGIMRGN
jgi:hypothetical protein